MALYQQTYHAEMIEKAQEWSNAWQRIAYLIKRDARQIYQNPQTAQAYFHAMGDKAVDTCSLSAVFAAALNETASILGKEPIGDVVPPGFILLPQQDGTVQVEYSDPQSSSSSSGI